MPVEIMEIIVRANVQDVQNNDPAVPATNNENNDNQRQALIKACVEQVLQILRHDKER